MASFENIIMQIENAHQDALKIFESLENILLSEEDFDITLSTGKTYTIRSYANLTKEVFESMSIKEYTSAKLDTATLPNLYDYIKFVDSVNGSDGQTGAYDQPYATISKAIREVKGKFGIILLQKGQDFSLYRQATNGELLDVIVKDKKLVFDVYDYTGATLTIGYNVTPLTVYDKPVIYPRYSGADDNSSHASILATSLTQHLKTYTSILQTTDNIIDVKNTIPEQRPYSFSFVLLNSDVTFNNILISNGLKAEDTTTYETDDPYFTANSDNNPFLSGLASNDFVFRPIPSIFKDFYINKPIDETTGIADSSQSSMVNEMFFGGYRNKVSFNECSFVLYASNGGLFYFNNLFDTSKQYEVTMNSSTMEPVSSETSVTGAYHKYGSLVYLEDNRLVGAENVFASQPFYKARNWQTDEAVLTHKYELNFKKTNFRVHTSLTKGTIDDNNEFEVMYANPSPNNFSLWNLSTLTANTYNKPFAFNLFRFVECFRYIQNGSTSCRRFYIISERYLDSKKSFKDYNIYGYDTGLLPTYTPDTCRFILVQELGLTTSASISGTNYTAYAGTDTPKGLNSSPVCVK